MINVTRFVFHGYFIKDKPKNDQISLILYKKVRELETQKTIIIYLTINDDDKLEKRLRDYNMQPV